VPHRNHAFRFIRLGIDVVQQHARAAAIFDAADVPQDGEKPRLDFRASEPVEMAQRPQVAFLQGVVRIGHAAQ
jgi:hypothetical protein